MRWMKGVVHAVTDGTGSDPDYSSEWADTGNSALLSTQHTARSLQDVLRCGIAASDLEFD